MAPVSPVRVVAVVLVAMVMAMLSQTEAYSYRRSRYSPRSRPSSLSSSFYSRYGSGSRYRSPKARYVHSYSSGVGTHRHPHPPQAIAIPVNVGFGDDDGDNHVDDLNRIMTYGYGDSLLLPIEGLLRDLAGYTGYKQSSIPGIVRNIKHEFYIGANKQDPFLHNILKRYGFMFTGNPADLGIGAGGQTGQGGLNGILGSIGLGGNQAAGGYTSGAGLGVSSVQNPLPGMTGGSINDDLFDDFGNGLLASSNTASAKQESALGNANAYDPLGILT